MFIITQRSCSEEVEKVAQVAGMATSGKRRSFSADLDQLKTCFRELDSDDTGYIGFEQLRKLVQSLPDTEESVVPDLWEKLDRNKDGKVSLDDFTWLFQLERETKKKKPKLLPQIPIPAGPTTQTGDQTASVMTSPSDSHCKTALDDSGDFSPSERLFETSAGSVVLRHSRRRATMPSRLSRPRGSDSILFSPIQTDRSPRSRGSRSSSSDMPDLASQMKYLTEAIDSPQLRRGSKVLSWIESGDVLFEDTGTGLKGKEDLPSPPPSPMSKNADLEVSHVESILEDVCSSKEINKEAVLRLCGHVNAEPQEEQELLLLLNHIDKDNKGYVSVTEFARGLQAIRNTAKVGTSTPAPPGLMRRYHSELIASQYSEAFGTPLGQGLKPQFSSTPSMPKLVTHDSTFSFLDPKETGSVRVEEIVAHWQRMGVETASNQDIEKVVNESFPVDPSGRVSMGDMTASLEGSILTDGKSPSILRQAAVKTFKKEISTLKTHVHQVSTERDKLQRSLNRTMEEKAKVIKEGDEHVESILKKADKKIKEQQNRHFDETREKERAMRQEALQFQEQASFALRQQEEIYEKLKREEDNLRHELKYANEEKATLMEQLSSAQWKLQKKDKTIEALQKDLGSRSENDLIVDESQVSRFTELEGQLADKNGYILGLQDKLREINDNCDELKADHEKMRQKYYALKRKTFQKSQSLSNSQVKAGQQFRPRRPSGDSRSRFANRPLSGSHFHKRVRPINTHIKTSMDLDLAVPHSVLEGQDEADLGLSLHFGESSEMDTENEDTFDEVLPRSTEESDTDDDRFGKSTASLLEELQQNSRDTHDQRQVEELEEECKRSNGIIRKLKAEIFRLEEQNESQQDQLLNMEEKNSHLSAEITEAHYMVESERKSHEVEVNILTRKIDNAEQAVAELESESESLKEEHRNSIALLRKSSVAEVQDLRGQLAEVRAGYARESEQQATEMQHLKELLQRGKNELLKSSENYMELGEKHSEEMEAVRYKLRVTVEELHKQLNVKEKQVEELQVKLKAKEKEQESLSSTLDILHDKEEEYKSQMAVYEENECEYKTSVTRLEGEISQLLASYSRRMMSLRDEFNKGVSLECSTLQRQLEELACSCDSRLNEAQRKFATLVSCLKDNDLHHANAVKSLLFELHQSQRDINSLKDEADLLRCQLDISHSELEKMQNSRDVLQDFNKANEVEIEDLKSKLEQAKRRRPISLVEADSGQVISEQDDIQLLESTIHALRNEVESLKHAERCARHTGEEANRRVLEKDGELRQAREKTESLQRDVEGFESRLQNLQNECKSRVEEIDRLNESLQMAKKDHQKSKMHLDLQTEKTIEQLKDKHLIELDMLKEVVDCNKQDARKLYTYVLEANEKKLCQTSHEVDRYTHAQLMLESMKEINSIRIQLRRHQDTCTEMEALLEHKLEEHEILEAQFTAEHEEEVRALRQQKQHLMEQLDESKVHYENIIESQDEQHIALKQELTKTKSDMEKELQHKTEEMFHVYQKVADMGEEKKVLLDIIKQLCVEAGRQIDVV